MRNVVRFRLAMVTTIGLLAVMTAVRPEFVTSARAARVESSVEDKEAKVRKLLELTGAGDMGKQVADAMMDQFATMPNLPPGFAEKFKQLAQPSQLVDLIVPIYMKHLDAPTLDAAIAFYSSPAGRTLASKQSVLVQESMQAGQQWGQNLAMQVLQGL